MLDKALKVLALLSGTLALLGSADLCIVANSENLRFGCLERCSVISPHPHQ